MTPMSAATARFPDWSSLSELGRIAALEQCRRRLTHLGRKLHAVEHIYHAEPPRQGPLSGLPYVAKDLFATGRSEPSWGCSTPQALALPRASVIDRLDQAGASLIGAATMTELAYEASGIGRRCCAQSVAVRRNPRRVLERLRDSCGVRLLFCRARLRYRRLRANTGALLRHHRAQTGLRQDPAGWRDGARTKSRHHRRFRAKCGRSCVAVALDLRRAARRIGRTSASGCVAGCIRWQRR